MKSKKNQGVVAKARKKQWTGWFFVAIICLDYYGTNVYAKDPPDKLPRPSKNTAVTTTRATPTLVTPTPATQTSLTQTIVTPTVPTPTPGSSISITSAILAGVEEDFISTDEYECSEEDDEEIAKELRWITEYWRDQARAQQPEHARLSLDNLLISSQGSSHNPMPIPRAILDIPTEESQNPHQAASNQNSTLQQLPRIRLPTPQEPIDFSLQNEDTDSLLAVKELIEEELKKRYNSTSENEEAKRAVDMQNHASLQTAETPELNKTGPSQRSSQGQCNRRSTRLQTRTNAQCQAPHSNETTSHEQHTKKDKILKPEPKTIIVVQDDELPGTSKTCQTRTKPLTQDHDNQTTQPSDNYEAQEDSVLVDLEKAYKEAKERVKQAEVAVKMIKKAASKGKKIEENAEENSKKELYEARNQKELVYSRLNYYKHLAPHKKATYNPRQQAEVTEAEIERVEKYEAELRALRDKSSTELTAARKSCIESKIDAAKKIYRKARDAYENFKRKTLEQKISYKPAPKPEKTLLEIARENAVGDPVYEGLLQQYEEALRIHKDKEGKNEQEIEKNFRSHNNAYRKLYDYANMTPEQRRSFKPLKLCGLKEGDSQESVNLFAEYHRLRDAYIATKGQNITVRAEAKLAKETALCKFLRSQMDKNPYWQMTKEQREEYNKKRCLMRVEKFNNMSPSEQQEFIEDRREKDRQRWASIPFSIRQLICARKNQWHKRSVACPECNIKISRISLKSHEACIHDFCSGLLEPLSDNERKEIFLKTTQGHLSSDWRECRRGIITGTRAYSICCKHVKPGIEYEIARNMLKPSGSRLQSWQMERGIYLEKTAFDRYLEARGIPKSDSEYPVGLSIHKDIRFLGATGDGFVTHNKEQGVIEIKCTLATVQDLVSRGDKMIIPASQGSAGEFLTPSKDKNHYQLNPRHRYFYQVLMQLFCCAKQFVDFVIYYQEGSDKNQKEYTIWVQRFYREDVQAVWEVIKAKLVNFYYKYMVGSSSADQAAKAQEDMPDLEELDILDLDDEKDNDFDFCLDEHEDDEDDDEDSDEEDELYDLLEHFLYDDDEDDEDSDTEDNERMDHDDNSFEDQDYGGYSNDQMELEDDEDKSGGPESTKHGRRRNDMSDSSSLESLETATDDESVAKALIDGENLESIPHTTEQQSSVPPHADCGARYGAIEKPPRSLDDRNRLAPTKFGRSKPGDVKQTRKTDRNNNFGDTSFLAISSDPPIVSTQNDDVHYSLGLEEAEHVNQICASDDQSLLSQQEQALPFNDCQNQAKQLETLEQCGRQTVQQVNANWNLAQQLQEQMDFREGYVQRLLRHSHSIPPPVEQHLDLGRQNLPLQTPTPPVFNKSHLQQQQLEATRQIPPQQLPNLHPFISNNLQQQQLEAKKQYPRQLPNHPLSNPTHAQQQQLGTDRYPKGVGQLQPSRTFEQAGVETMDLAANAPSNFKSFPDSLVSWIKDAHKSRREINKAKKLAKAERKELQYQNELKETAIRLEKMDQLAASGQLQTINWEEHNHNEKVKKQEQREKEQEWNKCWKPTWEGERSIFKQERTNSNTVCSQLVNSKRTRVNTDGSSTGQLSVRLNPQGTDAHQQAKKTLMGGSLQNPTDTNRNDRDLPGLRGRDRADQPSVQKAEKSKELEYNLQKY